MRSGTLDYLRGLAPEDFDVVPRQQRPELTVGVLFRQVVGELYQHVGQIAYLKGLQRGFADAFPPTYGAP